MKGFPRSSSSCSTALLQGQNEAPRRAVTQHYRSMSATSNETHTCARVRVCVWGCVSHPLYYSRHYYNLLHNSQASSKNKPEAVNYPSVGDFGSSKHTSKNKQEKRKQGVIHHKESGKNNNTRYQIWKLKVQTL